MPGVTRRKSASMLPRRCRRSHRRAHDPVKTTILREPSVRSDLIGQLRDNAGLDEIVAIHAGWYGHPDDKGSVVCVARRLPSRLHHSPAAARVDVQHPHAPPGRGPARACNRVRYIVKLQIEEDVEPQPVHPVQDRGSGRGEQLHADFDPVSSRIEACRHCERFVHRREIESDDNPRTTRPRPIPARGHSPSTP